jgi:hypothetical protein
MKIELPVLGNFVTFLPWDCPLVLTNDWRVILFLPSVPLLTVDATWLFSPVATVALD